MQSILNWTDSVKSLTAKIDNRKPYYFPITFIFVLRLPIIFCNCVEIVLPLFRLATFFLGNA